VGGQTRARLAAIDVSGTPTSWNPAPNGLVYGLALSGSGTLYVGGGFTAIGGQARSFLAALDGTGAVTGWNPGANDVVSAFAFSGSTVYAGGDFTMLGGQPSNYAGALDVDGGTPITWMPNSNLALCKPVPGGTP